MRAALCREYGTPPKLEVDNVLKGSILKNNKEIQLSFDLINISEGKVLWNEKWSELIINNSIDPKEIYCKRC